MTDLRDAEPHPPDDSGGYCCVSAGMHMGHDEDCPRTSPWDAHNPATLRALVDTHSEDYCEDVAFEPFLRQWEADIVENKRLRKRLEAAKAILCNDGRWWDSPPGHAVKLLEMLEAALAGEE